MFTASTFRAALVAIALSVPAAHAAGERDLNVEVRISGDEIRSQATLFVPASQQRVWDVITDYERAPEFTPDLQESKILSRTGNTLRVFQKNRFRFGPFSVPVETVRDVRLTAPVRAESRLVKGSMKHYTASMELVPEAGGTRIVYSAVAIPSAALAMFATESFVKSETEAHLKQLRAEILRRDHLASARPQASLTP